MDRLLRAKAAGEVVDLSPREMLRRARKGLFPSIKLGRSIRFSEQALQEWIRRQAEAAREQK